MKKLLRQVGERIRKLRLNADITQVELARRVGKSKQLISSWKAGRSEVTVPSLIRLGTSLNVDLNWLLLGERRVTPAGRVEHDPRRIPLIPEEQCLHGITQAADLSRSTSTTLASPLLPDDCLAILNRYDAMAPNYRIGDILYVAPCGRVEPGDIVAALIMSVDGHSLDVPALLLRKLKLPLGTGEMLPFTLAPLASGFSTITISTRSEGFLIGPLVSSLRMHHGYT